MSFSALGLSKPLLRALDNLGYSIPTPIQLKTIPAILAGRDLMAAAQTGTGKTAGFTLPLLQQLACGPKVKANHIRALVLTPTRELAVQVAESTTRYGKHLELKSCAVYGGVKINPQMMKLRGGVDLLIATPGRLLDLFDRNALKFSQLETLVLDEADRMLDLGFSAEIRKILSLLPRKRQNLLFSATFSRDIRQLCEGLLNNPLQIEVNRRNSAAKNIKQSIYEVDKGKKTALLCHLVRTRSWTQLLVFTRTKRGADNLVKRLLSEDICAAAIHGDKSQAVRSQTLAAFKANNLRVLVATDIAARGIDIQDLPRVINFDLPKIAEDYIHRIGRTGRAGLQGEGISLVSADEVKLLVEIEALICQTLVREVERGFIPVHSVPLTQQMRARAKKAKKPKKPRQNPQQAENSASAGAKKNSDNKPRKGRDRRPKSPKETSGGRRRQRSTPRADAAGKRGATKPKPGQRT